MIEDLSAAITSLDEVLSELYSAAWGEDTQHTMKLLSIIDDLEYMRNELIDLELR